MRHMKELPAPYYDRGGITIYHGDARDILPLLPKVDLLLTDPPYGLGDKWTGGTWGANPMYAEARKWDILPSDDTIQLMLTKAKSAVVWGGNYFNLPPSRCWLSWEKSQRMETMADFELAWTNLDRPCKAFTEARNPDGKRKHPTQKPISIMQWCLSFFPNAKTILDPFMGSGTTLVAAKALGLRAIGIELEEEYCKIAVQRLAQDILDFGEVA